MKRDPLAKFKSAIVHAETTYGFRGVLLKDPCVYCAVWPMPQRAADRKTIEHVTPRTRGGRNDWRNLACAHEACNGWRGDMALLRYFVFRQLVRERTGKEHRRDRRALRRALMKGTQ